MEHFLLPGAEKKFQDVMCISVCTPTLHFAPHRNQLQTINLRIKSMLYSRNQAPRSNVSSPK
jgi:hypothetical protein